MCRFRSISAAMHFILPLNWQCVGESVSGESVIRNVALASAIEADSSSDNSGLDGSGRTCGSNDLGVQQ